MDYLPDPSEKCNFALDLTQKETKVETKTDSSAPLITLAFKLEDTKYGQLTYVRIYQGLLKRGMMMTNVRTGKKMKLSRLVRMHSNEMEDVDALGAGEIGAMFGIECASGDTFTDGTLHWAMTSMFVPNPVVSLSLRPRNKENPNFSKALQKFLREDPTFRVHVDHESKEVGILILILRKFIHSNRAF